MNFFLSDCITPSKSVASTFHEFAPTYSFSVVNDRIFFNTSFPDFMHSHLKNLIDFVSDLHEKRELARTLINNALQCAVNGR